MVPVEDPRAVVLPPAAYDEMSEEELRAALGARDRELQGVKRSLARVKKTTGKSRRDGSVGSNTSSSRSLS